MRCRGMSFPIFSPDPLLPALVGLLTLNNPPPPGGGRSRRRSICDCGRDVGLRASRRAVPLSRYRSFATAVRFVVRGCGCLVRSMLLLKRFNAAEDELVGRLRR